MPGAARYELPQQQQQPSRSHFKQLAASVFEHLRSPTVRHNNGRVGAKVAAGNSPSPTKNSKSFKSIHSARSNRSTRSNRTGGRAADSELWGYDALTPNILNEPTNQQVLALSGGATKVGDDSVAKSGTHEVAAPAPPEIKRQSSRKKTPNADENASEQGGGRKKVRTQDLYDDYTMENDRDDGDIGDNEDDMEDDESQFDQMLTAEAQDELAYFSQRVGHSDFKLARRLVIHPHGRARAFWDSVAMLLITWILIVVPFELSFLELHARVRRDLLRFDLFVDCMFVIDIFLNFNTGIEKDGKLHFSFRSIYRHYVWGWFVPDVIWTIPFYLFYESHLLNLDASAMSATLLKHSQLYNAFRVLRLLRVAKLPHVRRRLEYSLLISSRISSLGSFLYVVLALSHVFSCMFAYLAFGDQEHLTVAVETGLLQNDDIQTKYIASFYWAMMTMTTVGYGDITVRTNTGRIFALAAMVVGGGIFAYGVTNVVTLFQQLYTDETEHRQKMDAVNTFMHSRHLPRKLRDEIRANFFHMRKATRESKKHDYEIFCQMSRTLQSNVATLFCQDMMPHKLPFLAGCNAEFIHELYLSMEVRCYLPGEDIIRQDDYGTEMYFLFVGHVQVFLSHTKVAALGPNTFFGEFGIFNPNKPRLATIQAMDFCETHCIQRRDVFRIIMEHPFMLRSIKYLAALRSRKALNIMYESGGKSRTLLQGLASMWHQEGILGMVPRSATREDLMSLQEYLPVVPVNAAANTRRTSVRATLMSNLSPHDAAATMAAAGAGGRRRSVVLAGIPDLTLATRGGAVRGGGSPSAGANEADVGSLGAATRSPQLRSQLLGSYANAGDESSSPPVRVRRRTSIDGSEKARVAASLASIGKRESAREGLALNCNVPASESPAVATASSATAASSTAPSDLRWDVLIAQMHDIAKRQELLDDQMQEILQVLTSDHQGLSRFNEQYQQSAAVPPLVRDRSQYFHRGFVTPEDRESRSGR